MPNVRSVEKTQFVVWLRSQGVPERLFAPYVRWRSEGRRREDCKNDIEDLASTLTIAKT
jgi:hypothetical protein